MEGQHTARNPVLVVCDAQNDFIEDDGWFVRAKGTAYSPEQKAGFFAACRKLIDAAHARGVPVIYLRTTLRADRLDSGLAAKLDGAHAGEAYLVEGTWGAEIVAPLAPEPRDIIVQKTADSAFNFSPFHRILRNLGADSLIMIGGPLYRTVNATGRDAAAHGYTAFAVPDALYPIGFERPELLRMRTHTLAMADALERLNAAPAPYGYNPGAAWTSLIPQSCLLLIDLQNGFVRRDGFFAGFNEIMPDFVFDEAAYAKLLANNARLIAWARSARIPVINVYTANRRDGADNAIYIDAQFSGKPVSVRCVEGDWNAEYASEIAPEGNDISLLKHGHSAFKFTILDRMLINLGVRQCIVTGGNVAGCLEETLRDGCALGYEMVTVKDAAYRPGDERIHLMDEEVEVVTTEQVLKLNLGHESVGTAYA